MEKKKIDKNTLKRLFCDYILKYYKFRFFIVIILVIVTSLVGVASSLFIERLIDDYISPMLGESVPNFTPLIKAICVMICIYLTGVISSYVYQRMMSRIAQRNIESDS